jgi:hypothetical protein
VDAQQEFAEVTLPVDGTSGWAGMGSFRFQSPDGKHVVEAPYESEPPHGDSFHLAFVDDIRFPGFFWGCNFAWDPDSTFFVASWMAAYIERRTVVINVSARTYFVLPEYFSDFSIRFPVVQEVRTEGVAESHGKRAFVFKGTEQWSIFGR